MGNHSTRPTALTRTGSGVFKLSNDDPALSHSADVITNRLHERFRNPVYRPPVLPRVALEILALASNPNVDFPDIVDLLEQDQVLAGDVIKLARSAAFAGGRVRSLLDEHHLLVLPGPAADSKRAEGLPTAAIEALAAGRPVVAGRTGGVGEIVGPEVGAAVPPGNLDAILEAVDAFDGAPALLLEKGKRARQRAAEHSSARAAGTLLRALR